MSSPKVLVIGCGISGPAIAIFLKRKGYSPIVFEKTQTPGDVGASLMIWPNGMKVLDLVGLAARVIDNGPSVVRVCEKTFSGEVLAQSSLPAEFQSKYGQPANGIKRTMLTSMLRDAAVKEGIEVRAGWALESIHEGESSVTAMFSGGREETGSFLIGCDGTKSVSRKVVLEYHGVSDSEPDFTEIMQVR